MFPPSSAASSATFSANPYEKYQPSVRSRYDVERNSNPIPQSVKRARSIAEYTQWLSVLTSALDSMRPSVTFAPFFLQRNWKKRRILNLDSTTSLLEDFLTPSSDEPDIPSDIKSNSPSLLSAPSVTVDIFLLFPFLSLIILIL